MTAHTDWDRSRNLGHSLIDADHRLMVERIDALVDLLSASPGELGRDPDVEARIRDAVAALRRATEAHDHDEEAIMRTAGYPLLISHQRQHQDFLAQFARFSPLLFSPKRETTQQFIDFFRAWRSCHLDVWDVPLVEWLNARAHGEPRKPDH